MSDDLTQLAERIFERLPVKCPTCGSEEPTTYYGSCFDNQHDTVFDPRLPMDPWHAYMQDLRLLLRRLDGMTVSYEVGRTLLAEARDEITRLTERLSDSWYVDIGERLDAALTEVVRLRQGIEGVLDDLPEKPYDAEGSIRALLDAPSTQPEGET